MAWWFKCKNWFEGDKDVGEVDLGGDVERIEIGEVLSVVWVSCFDWIQWSY